MPSRFIIDNVKGLIENSNGDSISIDSAVTQNSRGIVGMVSVDTTGSIARTSGGTACELDLSLPPGAFLTDVGFVVTGTINQNSGADIDVRVGTGTDADVADICANAKLATNATTVAAGTAIAVNGSNSEGAAALAFAASATMWSSSARTIKLSLSSSANNIIAGQGKAFAKYIIV